MSRKARNNEISKLDALIEKIVVDAYGDDEQLSGFACVIDDEVTLPADAFVIGEPISVVKIGYKSGPLRGLTARCLREDGTEYEIAAADICFPEGSDGSRYIAAYRRWMGLDPWPEEKQASHSRKRTHQAKAEDLDLAGPIDLVALLAAGSHSIRCLDAHAHLGNLLIDKWPEEAVRRYEAGVRIGELSLGSDFIGLLPWGFVDNRPFLRCLHGYGLCLWKMGRFEDAENVFRRMLWFNPDDNQGARFNLASIRAGEEWHDPEEGRRK